MKSLSFPVAGSRFRAERWDKNGTFAEGDEILLQAEPTNPFDRNAIQVWHQGHHLGFVPKSCNVEVGSMLHDGCESRLSSFYPERKAEERFVVEVKTVE